MHTRLLPAASALLLLASLLACEAAPPPSATPTADPASQPGQPDFQPDSSAASQPAAPLPERLEATTHAGHYKVALEFEPRQPPMGTIFSAIATVTDATSNAPLTGATFKLDATMPEHKHGMMTQPRVTELGDGRYKVEGLKLHMPGRWVFQADLEGPAGKETVSFEVHQGALTPQPPLP